MKKANRILAAIHALDPMSNHYRVNSEEGCAPVVERYIRGDDDDMQANNRWIAMCFPHDADRLTRALLGLVELL